MSSLDSLARLGLDPDGGLLSVRSADLQRLERLRVVGRLSLSDADRLLELRAAQLARPAAALDAMDQANALVGFEARQSRFAVPSISVAEVRELGKLALLPGAPVHTLGAVAFRGQLLGVVDLATLLAEASSPRAQPPARLVILTHDRGHVALACDSLQGLLRTSSSGLSPARVPADRALEGTVRGVDSAGFAILDVAALFRVLSN